MTDRTADQVAAEPKKYITKALTANLPRGGEVTGYLSPEEKNEGPSFYFAFRNKEGRVTRLWLSHEAVQAMAQIAKELVDPDEVAA